MDTDHQQQPTTCPLVRLEGIQRSSCICLWTVLSVFGSTILLENYIQGLKQTRVELPDNVLVVVVVRQLPL